MVSNKLHRRDDPIQSLTDEQSWDLLRRLKVGRLAVSVANQPDVYPVNYVVDDRSIVLKTSQGSKLAEATINPHVAFEVDRYDASSAVSVIVRGDARIMEDDDGELAASVLHLISWVPTVKLVLIRIDVGEITGRRFDFGVEPELDLY